MSIASEITRLQGVKSDILQAISDKGVVVPAGSALADCPGLIINIPTGESDDDVVLPTGYTRVQYVELNGTKSYCDITQNSIQYEFGLPRWTFGDGLEITFSLNCDKTTSGKQFNLIDFSANGGSTRLGVEQVFNHNGNPYSLNIYMSGIYNYGSYQTNFYLDGEEYLTGVYKLGYKFDGGLKGFLNSSVHSLGTAPSTYSEYLGFFGGEFAPTVYKGTRIFGIKVPGKFNFIPCKNYNNVVGFYEVVNNKFIYQDLSQCQGSFTAGPNY